MSTNTTNTINTEATGNDMLKGNLFFSNLTPGASFSSTPKYFQYSVDKNSSDKLTLTLQKVKDSLKEQLTQEEGVNFTDSNSDQLVENYLLEFVTLLVDYRDVRNFVFFGSAYTELSYNIKFLVENYPYKHLISTLTTDLNTINEEFTLTYNSSTNTTEIVLKQSAIRDAIEEFNFFDNNLDFNWTNYDIVDVNNIHYPVQKVITPYDSASIFLISAYTNTLVTPVIGTPYTTLKITTPTVHGYLVGQAVNIVGSVLQNTITGLNDQTLDDNYIVSQIVSTTEFLIVSKYAINKIVSGDTDLFLEAIQVPVNYIIITNGRVRKISLADNTRPYDVYFLIEGNLTESQLITYTDVSSSNGYSGFLISLKQSIISEFEFNLTPIQRMLLAPSPINPTPWPRRQVTKNIQHLLEDSVYNPKELAFIEWLQSPSNLYLKDNENNEDIAFSDLYTEYRLARALTFDETETNQLLRRCIPEDVISELNDTSDFRFQRFILVAGWFFDQIKVYIQFIKYVHHINFGDFNQLSPQYYKFYADYYGFELFDDDSIDFSKLVIKTEPGFYFINSSNEDPTNKYYKLTLKQLQYERQKRLLLSLFYLYRAKGTAGTIKKLISLLGAPDGFLIFNEFSFQIQNTDNFDYFDGTLDNANNLSFTGKRVVDNQKVYVPKFHFEPDPQYPVIDNQPPVYKMRLHNESDYNLREASILTNPNGAVDSEIFNIFGKQKSFYAKFQNGEFANLQSLKNDFSLDKNYYGLPLTIPDKFTHFTIEYMIPRDGFKKGVANNLDEASIHLCSLYQLSPEVVNNIITSVYTYPLPEVFSNFDYASVRTTTSDTVPKTDSAPNTVDDFNILNKFFNNSTSINITNPYIIIRIEGKDLVVRCRLQRELPSGVDIGERVAIYPNLFDADGLNHTLKIQFRPEGIEIYQDYKHLGLNKVDKVGIATWKDPSTSGDSIPYCAFEIPKQKIFTCQDAIYDGSVFFALPDNENNVPTDGNDTPKYWDLFVGMPINLDLYFKKIEISEGYSIDSFDLEENLVNSKNYTSEFYSFDFIDNAGNNKSIAIRCEFSKIQPDIIPANYTYILPTEAFNNKIVVKNLILTSKSLLLDTVGNQVSFLKYFNIIQDFFNITKDVFGENAYSRTLHKDYEYINFYGKVINLYTLYSTKVLTYDLLANFLDLIENKFQNIIKSFIPIVINISEFGRLITNSAYFQPKVRYTAIEKNCDASYVGRTGIMQERVYTPDTGIQSGVSLTITLINSDLSNLIGPITVPWGGTVDAMLGDILIALRQTTNNPYNDKILISLNDDLLITTINTQWYYTLTGFNVNDVIFRIFDGTNTLDKKFSSGFLDTSDPSCGYIEYTLPNRPGNDVFVFFDSENQPSTFIYFDSETGKPITYIN